MIYVIMGKSATGKDSIYNEIMRRYPDMFQKIIPYTTRPKRKNETDGVEYNFSTIKDFKELEKKNLVVESRTYNTNKGLWTYYTVNENIDPNLTYLMIGTIESFKKIKEYFKNTIEVIPIYIWIEDHDRLMRAIKREEEQDKPDYLELCRRYLADAKDFSDENEEYIMTIDKGICYKNKQSIEKSAEFIVNIIQMNFAKEV